MKVDKELVDRIAALAKLEFDDASKVEIIKDLDNILAFVEKLNELDTSGVEPLVYITDKKNVFRNDEVKQEINKEQALQNAPMKDNDYFKVPKMINK